MSLGYQIGAGAPEGALWADSLPVFGSTGYHQAMLGNFSCPVDDRHQLPRSGLTQRYESEEEEVSEVDTPNWEDRSFSATDFESEGGGFESDTTNDGCADIHLTADDDADTFTLRMHSLGSSADGYSRPTSVYTIKPTSNCGVLSPMPLLSSSEHQIGPAPADSDTLGSPAPAASPNQTQSTPSTSYESDPNLNLHSFYSDTLSSDDDFIVETPFLTATPITYYAPSCRPNLVSVSQHSLDSGPAKLTKKPKRLRPASVVRQTSTSSNRSTTTINNRARLQRNRGAKQDERRRSAVVSAEISLLPCSSTPSSATSPSSDEVTFFRTRDSVASSVASISDGETKPTTEEKNLWPLAPVGAPGRRMSAQQPQNLPQTTHAPPIGYQPAQINTLVNQPPRFSSYRTYANEAVTIPHPSTIGLASSSPKPYTPHASPTDTHPTPRRGSYNFYRTPPAPPVSEPQYYAVQTPKPPPFPAAWGDPFPSPPYSDLDETRPTGRGHTSRERSRSISSVASSSSKFSLPSFDTESVKSVLRRSRRSHHNDSTSSAGSSVGVPALPADRSRRLMMNADGCKSTSNLSFFFSSTDDRQGSESSSSSQSFTKMYRRSTASPSQQLMRLKNTKWFNETSETVSHVGSKAFSGIGSMLRKKSASPI